MDNTEIMNEVAETATEEIAESALKRGLKIAGETAAVAAIAYGLYRYVVRPLYRKYKSKKQITEEANSAAVNDLDDLEEVDE